MYDAVIIGGGAAGFYGAIQLAEARPNTKIVILERGTEVLTKVRISGGGRCNVTHAEFDPKELTQYYPRGEKELLGPFHNYASGDVVGFFADRDVALKIEEDGRMFPETDSSQTIIDCFLKAADDLGIAVHKKQAVIQIGRPDPMNDDWEIKTRDSVYTAKTVLIATGSNPKIWKLLQAAGHRIEEPVPSLFTFNIQHPVLKGLQGLSTTAQLGVLDPRPRADKTPMSHTTRIAEGPLLITHWGLSGPVVLKLSAWGARELAKRNYKFQIVVNWVPEYHKDGLLQYMMQIKAVERKTLWRTKVVDLPKRLWLALLQEAGISKTHTWPETTKEELATLCTQLTETRFWVNGKSTFKEEFVTAGGVDLKEINFKTFESKKLPGLFLAGEVLNIDAITGGFNFQSAWTGAHIAARSMAESLSKTD